MLSVDPKSDHEEVSSRPKSWNSITATVNKFVPRYKKSKSLIENLVTTSALNNDPSKVSQNNTHEKHANNALCKSSEILRNFTFELLNPNLKKSVKEISTENSKKVIATIPLLMVQQFDKDSPPSINKHFGRLRGFSENFAHCTDNKKLPLAHRKYSLKDDGLIHAEIKKNKNPCCNTSILKEVSNHKEIDSFLSIDRVENEDKEIITIDNTFLRNLISKVLAKSTLNMTYDPNLSIIRSRKISKELENCLKNCFDSEDPYRIIAQVFFGEIKDHGMSLAIDCDTQYFASSTICINNFFVSGIVALSK